MSPSSPLTPKNMDPQTALHTAARRYCQDRFANWSETYKELQAKKKCQVGNFFETGWDYSENEYKVFPRYRLDGAIQLEVERLIPSSFGSFEQLRTCLLSACDAAETQLLAELSKGTAKKALRDEAADYRAYIQVWNESDLINVEPLPFRRLITDEESKQFRKQLKEEWDVGNGYWFPLRRDPIPQNMVAFHSHYFDEMSGAQVLREELGLRSISRIFQLNEFGPLEPDHEIELSILEPMYASGGEPYCISKEFYLVVYAAHESSITISGGWLLDSFKRKWPEWSHRTCGGPFSTDDLRGTWNKR
jgi:hypothetical protein